MIEEDILKDIFRDPGLGEGTRHSFADQQGLCGMFENHGIAGNQRRCDGVDRRHVGIVPGRNDEDDAVGLPNDPALELIAVFYDRGFQGIGGDAGHVGCSFLETAKLAAVTHRPAHHPGKFGHDLVIHRADAGNAGHDQRYAFIERTRRPAGLHGCRPCDGGLCLPGRQHRRSA